ncbi:MAG: Rossmann-like and DUF2520 domain-containing protein [Flavobacteriales bacterium]
MLTSLTSCEVWVYARNASALHDFRDDILGHCIIDTADIPEKVDLTILAVNDDQIGPVSHQFAWPGLVVHTSGTVAVTALVQERRGVLWTLQSLKKNQETQYQNIPFFIQASTEKDTSYLKHLLGSISSTIYVIDDAQRLKVHLSAVITNNFSNHLYQIANEILATTSVSFDVLLPIIEEETRKIKTMNPFEIQTGPARRGDLGTIEKHKHLLASDPESLAIYQSITKSILKKYGHDQL